MTPEQLRDLCRAALEKMILDHQRLPGSIFRWRDRQFGDNLTTLYYRGIVDRFWSKPGIHRD